MPKKKIDHIQTKNRAEHKVVVTRKTDAKQQKLQKARWLFPKNGKTIYIPPNFANQIRH
jgi:hypothetical protein